MSVLENFKNIPGHPIGGRQGSNVIFFSSNLQRSPWRKKKRGACRPPPPGATGPCRLLGGRQGPLMQIGTIASVAFFFICSSFLVRLLCNFWYLKELCISCSLLTMMALHRIFTISMFERSYWWAYLLLAVHLTSSGSMAAKMGNASNISTTLWSSSTMPWDTCPASSSASTQTQWSVIVILSRGLWTY